MDLQEFRKLNVCQQIGISAENFPRIVVFIDFANVNNWFEEDRIDFDGRPLSSDQKIVIDMVKLADFLYYFADDVRFYYGHDPANSGSFAFLGAARHIFGKRRVFTKRIQKVRHNLAFSDSVTNTRIVYSDDEGDFVWIPKCNFDVEIAVDALRLSDAYSTFCLLSSDADFAALIRQLKKKDKKILLIKGGRIDGSLGQLLDHKIDAFQIKQYIAQIKQKPGTRPGFANS